MHLRDTEIHTRVERPEGGRKEQEERPDQRKREGEGKKNQDSIGQTLGKGKSHERRKESHTGEKIVF